MSGADTVAEMLHRPRDQGRVVGKALDGDLGPPGPVRDWGIVLVDRRATQAVGAAATLEQERLVDVR
jgi:hypothetical protein